MFTCYHLDMFLSIQFEAENSLCLLTSQFAVANISEENNLRGQRDMTLDQLEIGQSAQISAVGGEGDLRLRLLDMGLIPRTIVTLQKRAPMGDPIEIRVRGYELTLRVADAGNIQVITEHEQEALSV